MNNTKQADVDALWRTTVASIDRGDLKGAALAAGMLEKYMRQQGCPLPTSIATLGVPGGLHEETARAIIAALLPVIANGGSVMRGIL